MSVNHTEPAPGYIPTTEQIRAEWVESGNDSPTNRLHAEAAFNRWLVAFAAEVGEQIARDIERLIPGRHVLAQSCADYGDVGRAAVHTQVAKAYKRAAARARGGAA